MFIWRIACVNAEIRPIYLNEYLSYLTIMPDILMMIMMRVKKLVCDELEDKSLASSRGLLIWTDGRYLIDNPNYDNSIRYSWIQKDFITVVDSSTLLV